MARAAAMGGALWICASVVLLQVLSSCGGSSVGSAGAGGLQERVGQSAQAASHAATALQAPGVGAAPGSSAAAGGAYVMPFGKFRSQMLKDIPRYYLEWMVREQVFKGRAELTSALQDMMLLPAPSGSRDPAGSLPRPLPPSAASLPHAAFPSKTMLHPPQRSPQQQPVHLPPTLSNPPQDSQTQMPHASASRAHPLSPRAFTEPPPTISDKYAFHLQPAGVQHTSAAARPPLPSQHGMPAYLMTAARLTTNTSQNVISEGPPSSQHAPVDGIASSMHQANADGSATATTVTSYAASSTRAGSVFVPSGLSSRAGSVSALTLTSTRTGSLLPLASSRAGSEYAASRYGSATPGPDGRSTAASRGIRPNAALGAPSSARTSSLTARTSSGASSVAKGAGNAMAKKKRGKKDKVNLELMSSDQLTLFCPEGMLDSTLKSELEQIESAFYNRTSGQYQFSVDDYDVVIEALYECNLRVGEGILDAVPASVVKGLMASKKDQTNLKKTQILSPRASTPAEGTPSGKKKGRSPGSPVKSPSLAKGRGSGLLGNESMVPESLRQALMPFQLQGVRFALKQGGRAMIADEMGLGKTVQGLAIASVYRDEWPLLVLCPASLRLNWAAEIAKWLPDIHESDVRVVMSAKDRVDGLVTIISYDLMPRIATSLKNRFTVILSDESHYLKSPSAQRTKACLPLLKAARRAVLLTGTPALARPCELYSQLNGLRPKLFTSKREFEKRYCDAKMGFWGLDVTGASNLHELHFLLGEYVMIRRRKLDVLTQLPPKVRQQVFISVSATAVKQLKKKITEVREKMEERGRSNEKRMEEAGYAGNHEEGGKQDWWDRGQNEGRGELAQLYKETGITKLQGAAMYISDLIEGGGKLLVFAHHVEVLDGLEEAVKRTKAGYIRIDGSVPPSKRQERVNLFQTDDSVRAAVLGLTAAGTGLTLTAASTVVFVELHWTPGIMVQAEDRVHRIGQLESVNIHYLMGKGTLDDVIWPSIVRKLKVTSSFLDGNNEAVEGWKRRSVDDTDGNVTVLGGRIGPPKGQRGIFDFLVKHSEKSTAPLQEGEQQEPQAESEASDAAADEVEGEDVGDDSLGVEPVCAVGDGGRAAEDAHGDSVDIDGARAVRSRPRAGRGGRGSKRRRAGSDDDGEEGGDAGGDEAGRTSIASRGGRRHGGRGRRGGTVRTGQRRAADGDDASDGGGVGRREGERRVAKRKCLKREGRVADVGEDRVERVGGNDQGDDDDEESGASPPIEAGSKSRKKGGGAGRGGGNWWRRRMMWSRMRGRGRRGGG